MTDPTQQCSFSSKFASDLIGYAERFGANRDDLCRCLGLKERLRNRDDVRVPSATMARVWAEAHRQSNDPFLAFHMGMEFTYAARTTPSLIMQTSSTVLEAFEQAIVYSEIIANVLATELGRDGDSVYIDYRPRPEWRTAPPEVVHDSLAIAIVSNLHSLQSCVGKFISPTLLCFEFARPANDREYLDVFNASAEFDAPCNRIGFPIEISSLPTAISDNGLLGTLKRYGNELRAKILSQDPTIRQTREAVIDALATRHTPSIARAADQMHLSVRTLQRQLRLAGASFQAILDEVRQDLADRYLADDRKSLFEIAYLLGYSNPTAFVRAHKRWHGTTPRSQR